jgi:alkaline phosphatase
MKRLILLVAAALLILSPGYSKDKAPKDEKVKNVILMIGDGMGLGASSAWMIDQNYSMTCFDRAQFIGLCKTYSANNKVTDSAASATALATGNKTNNGMIGMLPDGTKVQNLTEYAKEKGKATGIVVTSHVVDATPGGFIAHTKSRDNQDEITRDLVSLKPDVIAGGGRKFFKKDGNRALDEMKAAGYTYVETPEEFASTTKAPVLGLFADGSYSIAMDHGTDYLADVTSHAIDLLDDNKNGFFLMVEGSHIDHASHANNAEQLLFEMDEFNKAVNAVFDYAETHPGTLVLVTADHETGAVYVLSNDKDFRKGESGEKIGFSTGGHSAVLVPLYAFGASSWKFSGVMENTDVCKRIRAAFAK